MFMDYVEIGTSDFDTEIEKNDDRKGLSIEPIKYYIDRLPDKKDCKKINIGISDQNGYSTIYYVNDENINKYNLPSYIRGCNSIDKYHPTVLYLLKINNIDIDNSITSYQIPIKTLKTVLLENNINSIYYLKIDTEGHDTVILKKYMNDIEKNHELPFYIKFESNILNDKKNIREILDILYDKGYNCIKQDDCDTEVMLNLQKLKNKQSFTHQLEGYYIMNYPLKYDTYNLPHLNTLEDAQKYCIDNDCSGITYENGKYEVRAGPYLKSYTDKNIKSWVYL